MKIFVKLLIFTILVPGSVTVAIPYWMLSSSAGFRSSGYRLLGSAPAALGAFVYLWCAKDFAFAGLGTPAPIDPPKRLVSNGLYRWVRNPMYVGILLVVLGEAILFASPLILRYALLLWVLFHLFIIYYEEPTLRKKFGTAYAEYCRNVPRWIPRTTLERSG